MAQEPWGEGRGDPLRSQLKRASIKPSSLEVLSRLAFTCDAYVTLCL